jgi:UDP-N-acetyl-D-mannosaminuronic acid dehydrogenase
MDTKLAILGGGGHVGLPLSLAFADAGCDVVVIDKNADAVAQVNAGIMPFAETGAAELLAKHVGKRVTATQDVSRVADAEVIVCVIGTPIDEHLSPRHDLLEQVVVELRPHLREGHLFVLRSTVAPGSTAVVDRWLRAGGVDIDVACCPERVAQGHSIREIQLLPQIVSGISERAVARARALFARVASATVEVSPIEAELAKLFCNSWRYVSFAVANQFYQICADSGIDFYRVHHAATVDYPRMQGLPRAGLAGGPCLFKDTMQLACFGERRFSLGQAAVDINEGFPFQLLKQLRPLDLADKTVGLLGMAFKGDSDDTRDSLAFRMRKLLKLEAGRVLCTDPFVKLPWFHRLDDVLAQSDVLVLTAPHSSYRVLSLDKPFLDPWNFFGRGGAVVHPKGAESRSATCS